MILETLSMVADGKTIGTTVVQEATIANDSHTTITTLEDVVSVDVVGRPEEEDGSMTDLTAVAVEVEEGSEDAVEEDSEAEDVINLDAAIIFS